MPDYHRHPLSAAEFRAAVARFRELYPGSVITSTHRSREHNQAVGGGESSKHLLSAIEPVACDLDWPELPAIEKGDATALQMNHDARVLGLWGEYHDAHMHLQGLAVGPVPAGWAP